MVSKEEIKRFYKAAQVLASEAGFTVVLDGKPIRTPGRNPLCLASRALAEAVAAEWAAQGETVRLRDMALMGLACTAIDLVAPRRAEVVAELAGYGATDLICYHADRPEALVERQNRVWRPLLDWTATHLDAPLVVATGTLAASQPDHALAALSREVARQDDLALAALALAVKASGSLVVGLALARGRLDAAGAFEAAELHETHQIEAWGEDAEATRRRAGVRADLETAARTFTLLRD